MVNFKLPLTKDTFVYLQKAHKTISETHYKQKKNNTKLQLQNNSFLHPFSNYFNPFANYLFIPLLKLKKYLLFEIIYSYDVEG